MDPAKKVRLQELNAKAVLTTEEQTEKNILTAEVGTPIPTREQRMSEMRMRADDRRSQFMTRRLGIDPAKITELEAKVEELTVSMDRLQVCAKVMKDIVSESTGKDIDAEVAKALETK
jgi:hypothetical protein